MLIYLHKHWIGYKHCNDITCCSYLIQLFESATRAVTNVARKHAGLLPNLEDPDDDDDEESTELFTVCSQLAAEDELLEPVNVALKLWEDSFCSELCDHTCLNCELPVTIDYLEVMVLVYKLMQVSNIEYCIDSFCIAASCYIEVD